ncbi:MAG: hydroxymethylbilane synthase [Planctomycetia bacterium]|nr:hydroxymethylbilane synthase [Planctomycetia bacterium]
MATVPHLRIGTRGSALARWQAEWTAARLAELGTSVELVLIRTTGDRQQEGPVAGLGSEGVFTKELQYALLDHRIDLAVHSLKDLPTAGPEGLTLGAVPERAPVADCLISRDGVTFSELKSGARIGTGSTRRRSQLWHARRDLEMLDLRGNVDTRLRKLDDGEFDAIVLAEAGLRRLGLAARITEVLPLSLMLPAVGQGALGIEIRADDPQTAELLRPLNHDATFAAVRSERAMLAALHGGCLAPVAGWGRVESGVLHLTGVVTSLDGVRRLEAVISGDAEDAEHLGEFIATELIAKGAAKLIDAARKSS